MNLRRLIIAGWSFLLAAAALALTFPVRLGAAAATTARPNVLFIAADDLRTDLGSYGHREAKTPHLDALARRGMVFERAYCQQAVCNPSRASMLTGRRPDTIKVWDLQRHFRETLPDIVTLPQHFKQHGYTTVGIGKLFHNQSGPRQPKFPFEDPPSWSRPSIHAVGAHWQDWVVPGDPSGPKAKGGAMQCLDVPDNAYFDGKIADEACAALREFGRTGGNFFLGVGFWKPHLPFNAPKKYWDLYDRAQLAPPTPEQMPAGAPAVAHHRSAELRNYDGIPKQGPLSRELIAELRHGYLAGISFLDAQVGRVLAELRRAGLEDNTIVVFWSDHGFHLGEHDLWGKTSNYELDARVPLIVAAPGVRGNARTAALVELIDVYPTLAELARLPAPAGVDGRSFAANLRDPARRGRDFAVTQHPQPFHGQKSTHMGYTLRTARHRYVEWRDLATGAVAARELYDLVAEPTERTNRIDDPALRTVAADLGARAAEVVAAGGRWPKLASP
jgi:iduronate 2-sulfatase